jgi:TrmH family RNA methyltransferase
VRSDPLRIVLASPRNPLNIGAAARAISNFGFSHLRLVSPYDVAYHEARSAVRAKHVLEQSEVFTSMREAISDCTLIVGTTSVGHRGLHIPLYRLEQGAKLVREYLERGNVALLFGSEKFGLSNDELSHCNWAMRIPTRTEHASMNLGQAVAICLYELRRDDAIAQLPEYPQPENAPAESLERLLKVLMDLLVASGYASQPNSQSTELKLRQLLRRVKIPPHDAEVLLGMLRQVLWKIRNSGP